MEKLIESIKKKESIDIPYGKLILIYNEAKVHYDSMLIYPPYFSIQFLPNEGLNPTDFDIPKSTEWGSFANINDEIKFIPDAELIEILNAPFYGLQPAPIKIQKTFRNEIEFKETLLQEQKIVKEKKVKKKKTKVNSDKPKDTKVKADIDKKEKKQPKKQKLIIDNIENDDESRKPITEKKKGKKNLVPLLIIILLILSGGGYYYYENYLSIKNNDFELLLDKKLDYAILSESLIELLNTQLKNDTLRYFLIVASEKNKKVAQKESAHYSSMGFSPFILYDSLVKRYRVALDSFNCRDTIDETKLDEVKARYRKDAWILKKRIGDG